MPEGGECLCRDATMRDGLLHRMVAGPPMDGGLGTEPQPHLLRILHVLQDLSDGASHQARPSFELVERSKEYSDQPALVANASDRGVVPCEEVSADASNIGWLSAFVIVEPREP